jgi:hypothetical protein
MTTRSRRYDLGKRLVFVLFGVAFLRVLWNNERFLLYPHAPEWVHLNPIRWHLISHGIGGAIALILGALQFSHTIRRRHPRVHRMFGKLYIIGTLILAPVAVAIAFVVSPWFMIVFTTVQSGTLLLFTLAAYACVRRRDFVAHREWMVRSYSILLIFLEGRVLMAIPALARRGTASTRIFSIQSPSTLAIGKGAEACNWHWRQKGECHPRSSRKRGGRNEGIAKAAANLVISPVLVRNLMTTVFESKRNFD